MIPGSRSTLAGIDELYWYKCALVAVQNVIGIPLLVTFRLSKDGLRVTQTTVLETCPPLTTSPTTGAIRGSDFYFIASSQIDNMNDDKVLDVTKPERVASGSCTYLSLFFLSQQLAARFPAARLPNQADRKLWARSVAIRRCVP